MCSLIKHICNIILIMKYYKKYIRETMLTIINCNNSILDNTSQQNI